MLKTTPYLRPAVALLASLALAACTIGPGSNLLPADDATQHATGPRDNPSQIFANPEPYLNRTVHVIGELHNPLGTRAFRIDEASPLDTNALLVVMRQEQPQPLTMRKGDVLEVRGEVRRFVQEEVEAELGIELSDSLFATIPEGEAVLIADEVILVAPGQSGY